MLKEPAALQSPLLERLHPLVGDGTVRASTIPVAGPWARFGPDHRMIECGVRMDGHPSHFGPGLT